MGFGVSELLILLLIVALLFGTRKLRSLGSDLGSAVKGFRSAVKDGDDQEKTSHIDSTQDSRVIEGEVESQKNESEKS